MGVGWEFEAFATCWTLLLDLINCLRFKLCMGHDGTIVKSNVALWEALMITAFYKNAKYEHSICNRCRSKITDR
jgi:hypothetical protein